jgi:hypothetical protein
MAAKHNQATVGWIFCKKVLEKSCRHASCGRANYYLAPPFNPPAARYVA